MAHAHGSHAVSRLVDLDNQSAVDVRPDHPDAIPVERDRLQKGRQGRSAKVPPNQANGAVRRSAFPKRALTHVVVVAARGRVVHATHVEHEIGAGDDVRIAATYELYVTEGCAKNRVG